MPRSIAGRWCVRGEAHGDTASALTVFRLTCERLIPQVALLALLSRRTCVALILGGDNSPSGMSALGHRRTLTRVGRMSASPPKTDCEANNPLAFSVEIAQPGPLRQIRDCNANFRSQRPPTFASDPGLRR